jgi:hypothetical protein
MNAGQVHVIADGALSHLERAREANDLKVIRKHLDEAIKGLKVLVDLAIEAAPPSEEDRC